MLVLACCVSVARRENWTHAVHATSCEHLSCNLLYCDVYEQPVVVPQVMHLRQVPLRTIVNWPQSPHGSPS